MTEEKEKIINAFNNAWNKKNASENSYGKLASKEMFENKEEIIIDVSNCRNKHDDDCMAMPICNEYGDLMDYQSCEAQTLCPYRTERIIDRLNQENEKLKKIIFEQGGQKIALETDGYHYVKALEEIREIAKGIIEDDVYEDSDVKAEMILDKINEVLNG